MPATAKRKTIAELQEKADGALRRGAVFEAERMAGKALAMARQIEDFARMAEVVVILREARRRRTQKALEGKKVTVWAGAITENTHVKPGCYVVEPPLVGADARRLRIAALHGEVPVAVICREPLTKLKQWPIVAIGAGMTIRARIEPPKNQEKPDFGWFTGAMEAIGDAAVQAIDPALEVPRRIDVLLERLDSVPDHDGLHGLLLEACREAAELKPEEESGRAVPAKRVKAKTAHEQP